jgi:hypothetical protein
MQLLRYKKIETEMLSQLEVLEKLELRRGLEELRMEMMIRRLYRQRLVKMNGMK